jgi:hypothetical protein
VGATATSWITNDQIEASQLLMHGHWRRKAIDALPRFAHNGWHPMNCRAVTVVLPSRQFAIQGEMHAEAVV